nr:hypothetical protein [Nitrospiraceae bacterium]
RGEDWSRLGAKGTYVHEVTGALHHTMLDEPYVEIWTKHLSRYLIEIQANEKAKSSNKELAFS